MGGATTVVEVIITDGAEATITVGDIITIGEIKFWKRPPLLSPVVQVFGRRHEEAIHALRRPASEKRQCTKSRECGTRQCSECYGDRMLVAISMVDAARAECFHNFRVLA